MTTVALVLAATGLVSGCSVRGSDYQYVRSRSTGTYLRLPEKWKVADFRGDEQVTFGRMFDGAEIDNERPIAASDEPTGFVQVRELSVEERDIVSFELLRNAFFDIDAGTTDGTIEVLAYAPADQGDFRGQRIVFRSETEVGTAVISQTVLLDPHTTRFHLLVVGCDERCYTDHEAEIDAVVTSLTIKET